MNQPPITREDHMATGMAKLEAMRSGLVEFDTSPVVRGWLLLLDHAMDHFRGAA